MLLRYIQLFPDPGWSVHVTWHIDSLSSGQRSVSERPKSRSIVNISGLSVSTVTSGLAVKAFDVLTSSPKAKARSAETDDQYYIILAVYSASFGFPPSLPPSPLPASLSPSVPPSPCIDFLGSSWNDLEFWPPKIHHWPPPWCGGHIVLGSNHCQIYLHMRAKFGQRATVVPKQRVPTDTDRQRDAAGFYSRRKRSWDLAAWQYKKWKNYRHNESGENLEETLGGKVEMLWACDEKRGWLCRNEGCGKGRRGRQDS